MNASTEKEALQNLPWICSRLCRPNHGLWTWTDHHAHIRISLHVVDFPGERVDVAFTRTLRRLQVPQQNFFLRALFGCYTSTRKNCFH